MSRKPKYSLEQKVQACEDYLSGKHTPTELARKLNIQKRGAALVRRWVGKYQVYGSVAFLPKKHNNSYTKEFKESVVREYLDGQASIEELSIKHNIPGSNTLYQWISMYIY